MRVYSQASHAGLHSVKNCSPVMLPDPKATFVIFTRKLVGQSQLLHSHSYTSLPSSFYSLYSQVSLPGQRVPQSHRGNALQHHSQLIQKLSPSFTHAARFPSFRLQGRPAHCAEVPLSPACFMLFPLKQACAHHTFYQPYGQGQAGGHPPCSFTHCICLFLKYIRKYFRCTDLHVLQEGAVYSLNNLTEKQAHR